MNQKTALEYLVELVNIPSYGPITEDHAIIKYLKENLSICAEIAVVKDKNQKAHLLVGVNTPLKDIDSCVVLSGHIDTVEETKGHEPKAKIQGKDMIGLGSSDMKCFWASVLEKLPELIKSDKPIVLSITTDEETELLGIESICSEMKKRNITPRFVVVGEPTRSTFSHSNTGNSIFVNIFKGVVCHTSTPQLGVNAILLASQMIAEVQKIDAQNSDVTMCITGIESKAQPSVVPDSCTLRVGVRSKNLQALAQVTQQLQTATDNLSMDDSRSSILLNVFNIPPFEDKHSEVLTEIAIKNDIQKSKAKFTTEAGYFQRDFPDADIVIYGAGDPDKIHKEGEFVNQEDVLKYGPNLVHIIEQYPIKRRINQRTEKGECKENEQGNILSR